MGCNCHDFGKVRLIQLGIRNWVFDAKSVRSPEENSAPSSVALWEWTKQSVLQQGGYCGADDAGKEGNDGENEPIAFVDRALAEKVLDPDAL